jgi:NAD(P)-dependent dehydrogenase (short-subunit alcohol dehydrogenase family)
MQSRVALVTGAGSGIGADIAQELAGLGHRVAILDRTHETATSVADQINASGGTAIAVHADVSDAAQVTRAVDEVTQALGPVGILDLTRYGITVNAVGPGTVQTEMTKVSAARAGRTLEDHLEIQAKGIPVGRIGTPHDIARAVLFFAAEDADFVTGQIIYVSGGPHH